MNTRRERERDRHTVRQNKTVRNMYGYGRKGTTRKNTNVPKYASTTKSIHSWYVSLFEKLGWMILAKAKGYDYKVSAYKKSIQNLERTIQHVMSEYESMNRKHDLGVMLIHLYVLRQHVMKHL